MQNPEQRQGRYAACLSVPEILYIIKNYLDDALAAVGPLVGAVPLSEGIAVGIKRPFLSVAFAAEPPLGKGSKIVYQCFDDGSQLEV